MTVRMMMVAFSLLSPAGRKLFAIAVGKEATSPENAEVSFQLRAPGGAEVKAVDGAGEDAGAVEAVVERKENMMTERRMRSRTSDQLPLQNQVMQSHTHIQNRKQKLKMLTMILRKWRDQRFYRKEKC